MRKLKRMSGSVFAVILLMLLTASAEKVRASCFDALLICGRLIIPSLFPFLVLSAFVTKLGLPGILGRLISPLTGRAYGISPAGASALIMGLLGGYPSGAAYIAAMEREEIIDTQEGERLIAFCNNSGPAFIIGVMGAGIFHSVKTGLQLYAVHILSALLTGFLFKAKGYSKSVTAHRLDETRCAEALVQSVKQAVLTIINICGFIIFFSVLITLMDCGGIFSFLCSSLTKVSGESIGFSRALLSGIFELGSAAAAMEGLSSSPLHLALAAALLGWGGLSVHFQTLAVLSDSKIKGSLHLAGRLISAMLAFILMYVAALI